MNHNRQLPFVYLWYVCKNATVDAAAHFINNKRYFFKTKLTQRHSNSSQVFASNNLFWKRYWIKRGIAEELKLKSVWISLESRWINNRSWLGLRSLYVQLHVEVCSSTQEYPFYTRPLGPPDSPETITSVSNKGMKDENIASFFTSRFRSAQFIDSGKNSNIMISCLVGEHSVKSHVTA